MATKQDPPVGKQNTLKGTTSLTLTIRDLRTVGQLTKKISCESDKVSKINTIVVDNQEEYVEEHNDPLNSVLHAIRDNGGSLISFIMKDRAGNTRSDDFWNSLFLHAPTLRTLHLTFTDIGHEIRPPQVSFPALRDLKFFGKFDSGGDKSFIDTLLKQCPGLKSLDFNWQWCSPKIEEITWDYNFPALKRLKLSGKVTNPEPLTHFLKRCKGVEEYKNDVNKSWLSKKNVDESQPSSVSERGSGLLPNLRSLTLTAGSEVHPASTWLFPTTAKRPLTHLRVEESCPADVLRELADLPPKSLDCIKVLHIKAPAFLVVPKEHWHCDEGSLASILKPCLLGYTQLEELHIGNDAVGWVHSGTPVIEERRLRAILGMLPQGKTTLRRLRLQELRAKPLSAVVLEHLQNVPKGLEELILETKEKGVFRFERDGETVKAVKMDEEWTFV